jgi:hypothetical protein
VTGRIPPRRPAKHTGVRCDVGSRHAVGPLGARGAALAWRFLWTCGSRAAEESPRLDFTIRRAHDKEPMLLSLRDRLTVARGLAVRGSTLHKYFESSARVERKAQPPYAQENELAQPRPGLRLVDLERAHDNAEPATRVASHRVDQQI